MTEQIAHDYKNAFARISLIPGSGGVFEVRVDGQTVYSKRQTGRFPDQDALVAEIGALIPPKA